jgi:hypothetical protein
MRSNTHEFQFFASELTSERICAATKVDHSSDEVVKSPSNPFHITPTTEGSVDSPYYAVDLEEHTSPNATHRKDLPFPPSPTIAQFLARSPLDHRALYGPAQRIDMEQAIYVMHH